MSLPKSGSFMGISLDIPFSIDLFLTQLDTADPTDSMVGPSIVKGPKARIAYPPGFWAWRVHLVSLRSLLSRDAVRYFASCRWVFSLVLESVEAYGQRD